MSSRRVITMLLATTLGATPASWAFDTGIYTGSASGCVFVDQHGTFKKLPRLDAELDIESSAVTFLANGASVTGAATLTLQGEGLGLIAFLSYRGVVNYTEAGGPEVLVFAESLTDALALTCERPRPLGLANPSRCQGSFASVNPADFSVVCSLKVKN